MTGSDSTGAPPGPRGAARAALSPLAPAAVVVVFVAVLGPWWSVYEFDTDEGLSLIKAFLVSRGHSMFADIWSDQPPLLAMVQGTLFRFVDIDVATGRAVVLAFAALMVGSLYRIVARQAGPAAAWAAVAVLATGALFLRLSVSSMIGLPAVALAVLSLDLALAYGGRESRWLLWGSAVAFALSMTAKLFTVIIGPPAALAVFLAALHRAGPVGGVRRVFEWGLVLTGAFLLLMAPFGTDAVDQLFRSHLTSRGLETFRHLGGPYHLWTLAQENPQYMVLGALGFLFAALPPGFAWKARLVPAAWIACAVLGLWFHRPIWYHHLLLVHVPLAWLAGLAVGSLRDAFAAADTAPPVRWTAAALLAAGVVASLPTVGAQVAKVRRDFATPPSEADVKTIAAIEAYWAGTRWLLTDRPIDAVRTKLPVPPWIAVYPSKRVQVGEIGAELLLEQFRQYRPEQVSFRRFYMGKPLKAYLDKNYRRIEGNPVQLHYVRPDMVPDGAAPKDR